MHQGPLSHLTRDARPHTELDVHPLVATWQLAPACEEAGLERDGAAARIGESADLTTAEGRALLDALAHMGTPLVVITGGALATRTDLVGLVDYASGLGIGTVLTTCGGPLLSHELLADLLGAGLSRVAVAIDGADAEAHDSFRRLRGRFGEQLRTAELSREVGLAVQVNTRIGPQNAGSLWSMAEVVDGLGAVLWHLFPVMPGERGSCLSPTELEMVHEETVELGRASRFGVKITGAPGVRRVLLQRRVKALRGNLATLLDPDGLVVGPRSINDGLGTLFISSSGGIFPSSELPLQVGNVRSCDVAEVYRNHPIFVALRDPDALRGKCGVCPFRRVCGGSRARAFLVSGDCMAADPFCTFDPPALGDSAEQSGERPRVGGAPTARSGTDRR